MKDKETAIPILIRSRGHGLSLHQAAAAAGLHVATVCRWQAEDPELHQALQEAANAFRRQWCLNKPQRPCVSWRRDCPLCRARVVVRMTPKKVWFWRCGRWPLCKWASWRPRAHRNCRRCGSPTFWSHSRKTIGCVTCGKRVRPWVFPE